MVSIVRVHAFDTDSDPDISKAARAPYPVFLTELLKKPTCFGINSLFRTTYTKSKDRLFYDRVYAE